MKICTIYGAPTPPGRLDAALQEVEGTLAADGIDVDRLSPLNGGWPDDACERVAAAGAIVIASPVYRASIPAVLKQLLDTLDVLDLHGKPVGLVVVGHAAEHQLAVRRHVADILEWFGALLVPTQVYCRAGDFIDGRPDGATATRLHDLAGTVTQLSGAVEEMRFAPAPFAQRPSKKS